MGSPCACPLLPAGSLPDVGAFIVERGCQGGISGLFFPPLWASFIWKTRWSFGTQIAVSGLLLVLIEVVNGLLFHFDASPLIGILLLNVLVIFLVVRSVRIIPEDTSSQRHAVESRLDACDDLIVEIEEAMSLDRMAPDSPARQQYAHALEMRAEALHMFERAASEADLVAAESRAGRSLDGLRVTQRHAREISAHNP